MLPWLAAVACAGVLDTYGAGEIGFAGNAGVASGGPHAAWYNPAHLEADRFAVGAEYAHGGGSFEVKPRGERAQSPHLESTRGALVGAALNSYWLGLPRATLGMALFLPVTGPYSWHEPPAGLRDLPPSAILPRWGSELARMDVAVGGGYQLTDRVWAGLGVDISASFVTDTWVELDDLERPDDAEKAQEVVIRPTFHPTLGLGGVAGDPDGAHVRLGALFRSGRKMDDAGTSFISLLGGDFLYRHHFVRFYAPPSLTVGADARPLPALSVRAEASYEAWSRAIGPYAEDLSSAWRNTVTGRLGARLAFDRLRVLGGVGFDPGPQQRIPRGTLHVDGPSHAFGGGLGAVLVDGERHLTALAGLHRQRFPTRTTSGVQVGGGWTGFRAGLTWGRP